MKAGALESTLPSAPLAGGGLGSTVQLPVHWKGVVVVGHLVQTPSVEAGSRDWTQVPASVESRTSLTSCFPRVIGTMSCVSMSSGLASFLVNSPVTY